MSGELIEVEASRCLRLESSLSTMDFSEGTLSISSGIDWPCSSPLSVWLLIRKFNELKKVQNINLYMLRMKKRTDKVHLS